MGWWQGCCRAQLLLGLLERGPCLDWSFLGHSPPQQLRWGEWFSSPAGAFEQRDHEVEPLASPCWDESKGWQCCGWEWPAEGGPAGQSWLAPRN